MSDNKQAGAGDSKATWSMILGLASLLCMCFTGIPAIILGALALPTASPAAKPRAWIGIVAGGLMTVIGLLIGILSDGSEPSSTTTHSSEPTAEVQQAPSGEEPAPAVVKVEEPTPAVVKVEEPTPPPPPEITVPASEQAFCDAINTGRDEYRAAQRAGSNELKLSILRTNRKNAVLSAAQGGNFKNWVGTIKTLSTNGDGKAILGIELPCDAVIGTWNNAFSDVMDQTLIPQSSPLYGGIAELSKRQKVKVSGKFTRSDKDGYQESSMTEMGSMTDPTYVVRFNGITGPL